MNLASNLARTAESTPAAPAITFDETVVPYGMLAQGAARVAGWLQDLGVQPGDRVAVSMPNIPHMPIVYYGILWAGAAWNSFWTTVRLSAIAAPVTAALGILAAAGQIDTQTLDAFEFAGELSLAGELRPVRGALALALAARRGRL